MPLKWKEGEIDGDVTYTWSSGEKYIGEYVNDRIDGQGTYTFPDGSILVGEFRDDEFWNGNEYDKEGTIIGRYVNGKYKTNKLQNQPHHSPVSNPH